MGGRPITGGRRGVHCGAACRCSGTERWQKKRGVALVSADTPGCPRFRRHRRTRRHAPRPPGGALRISNCTRSNCKSRSSFVNTNKHALPACLPACPSLLLQPRALNYPSWMEICRGGGDSGRSVNNPDSRV